MWAFSSISAILAFSKVSVAYSIMSPLWVVGFLSNGLTPVYWESYLSVWDFLIDVFVVDFLENLGTEGFLRTFVGDWLCFSFSTFFEGLVAGLMAF